MLQLDVLSAFVICGAGALVGAAMLRPSLCPEKSSAEALHLTRAAYLAIGVGLTLPVLAGTPLPLWGQAAMAFGSVAGVVVIGWALAALAGDRRPRAGMCLTLATMLVLVLAAWPAGTPGLSVACTLGLTVASAQMAWLSRRLFWRPHDWHERQIGTMVLLMLLSSMLRVAYLLTWHGAFEPYLLYVPPNMITPFTLMYGLLPILLAMLLNNVIHARLLTRLNKRAMTDHLTGTLTRHALAEGAERLIACQYQGQGRLAVIMIDLDHFKRFNDRHGHAGGDAVLCRVAELLQAQLRDQALLARYGGEEFVALVPVSDLPVARRVAERMRSALEDLDWSLTLPGLTRVTASLGVTLLTPTESLETALARADEALYRAKNGGRNQVQVGLSAA
jgi:diguanylate cyclase (GGDEF)-like protein